MIELLVSPKRAKREPWQLMALAAFFVSLAVVVNIAIPSIEGGIVTFAMVPAIPLIWSLLIREEREEEKNLELLRTQPFSYHLPLIEVFAFFFIGATVAYSAWYVAISHYDPAAGEHLFDSQVREIRAITTASVQATGSLLNRDLAWRLFEHNLVVLAFMFAFTLVYGIGSIYLLLWNASIIGVFIGMKMTNSGVDGFAQAILGIIPHGSLEVGAYFLAAIAGGILSAALMHEHHRREEFGIILWDVLKLTILSVVALGIGALLESTG